jgi:transcriptional regulator
MYIPTPFRVEETVRLYQVMETCSFATLVTAAGEVPFATHVPLLLEQRTDGPVLLGHVARANPHWRAFDGARQSLAIFHGPHAYVSPSWYENHPSVPTWNYIAVHVYGTPRVRDDEPWLAHLLERLVVKYESTMPEPWSGDLPDEFRRKMIRAVVGFEIAVERIEGKFKLGQNKPIEDQERVVQVLESAEDPTSRALAAQSVAIMRRGDQD